MKTWTAEAPGVQDGACTYAPIARSASGAEGRRDAPLAGLAGTSAASRFRSWSGRSGRRYVFSVYPIGTPGEELDRVPVESTAVVLAVERTSAGGRRLLWAAETGACPEAFFKSGRLSGLTSGRCELHLHLLAQDADERQAILADLDAV